MKPLDLLALNSNQACFYSLFSGHLALQLIAFILILVLLFFNLSDVTLIYSRKEWRYLVDRSLSQIRLLERKEIRLDRFKSHLISYGELKHKDLCKILKSEVTVKECRNQSSVLLESLKSVLLR
ncbi:hypothetical protein L1987_59450 [Smallanthus sonchifolius]|uniref:Uncharacterized protein n=1 Tax=Smallanthus sonchifolius TaxID=185202 RepID=A0ACB9D589_9ASTR|nr:hypothetical protein L1987_59450 [Smallanthus sonchifolius]